MTSWVCCASFSFVASWGIKSELFRITEFMIVLLSAMSPCITITIGSEIWDSIQLECLFSFWHHSNTTLNLCDSLLAEILLSLYKNSTILHAVSTTRCVIISSNELSFGSPSITTVTNVAR